MFWIGRRVGKNTTVGVSGCAAVLLGLVAAWAFIALVAAAFSVIACLVAALVALFLAWVALWVIPTSIRIEMLAAGTTQAAANLVAVGWIVVAVALVLWIAT